MCVISMVANKYALLLFFCFKQKTAYEMRISDWSSDVCSSDLAAAGQTYVLSFPPGQAQVQVQGENFILGFDDNGDGTPDSQVEIGRASCRERVCQYV